MISRLALLPIVVCVCATAMPQVRPANPVPARVEKPAEDAQVYRNATFGFRYRIPFGWVDRTKEMKASDATASDAPKSAGNNSETSSAKVDRGNAGGQKKAAAAGEVLLAVFERPPNVIGDTVNSAVVIATENAANYPGLKTAEDYVGPLSELASANGFKPVGDSSTGEIEGHEVVRADFTKALSDKLTMRQSTLILLTKGQIVSFTFIAGSEDEVNDLIEGVSFDREKSTR